MKRVRTTTAGSLNVNDHGRTKEGRKELLSNEGRKDEGGRKRKEEEG